MNYYKGQKDDCTETCWRVQQRHGIECEKWKTSLKNA